MKRIAIVGGGISGLSAAFALEEYIRGGVAAEYALYEASPRLGGVLFTEQIDGCVVEAGPDSFLSEKPWATHLCRAVGLGGGAAEIVGVGGNVAEAAHTGCLRHAVVGTTTRRARSFAGRRQLRVLHRDLRWQGRRPVAKVARRARVLSVLTILPVFLPERRPIVALLRR